MNRRILLKTGGAALTLTLLSPGLTLAQSPDKTAATISQAEAVATPVWLKRFEGAYVSSLLYKRRFRLFMEGSFPVKKMSFWFGLSLLSATRAYMGNPGMIAVAKNRYVTASGSMAHSAANRGMLWVDTKMPNGAATTHAVLVVLDAGRKGRNLWIIDNQAGSSGQTGTPVNLARSVRSWLRAEPSFKKLERGLIKQVRVIRSDGVTSVSPKEWGVPASLCVPSVYDRSGAT